MALTISRRKAALCSSGESEWADRVAGDSKDAGSRVEVLEPVDVAQGLGGDLAGSCFRSVGEGGEGEGGSGARTQNAADQAFFAHGDADDVRGERAVFDEPENGQVVGEVAGGGDDFDEVGLEGLDAIGGLIETLGAAKVVKADQQGCTGSAQLGQLGRLGFLGGFHFEVDDLAAGLGCLGEDFELGRERAIESAAVRLAAAGGNDGDVFVLAQELL